MVVAKRKQKHAEGVVKTRTQGTEYQWVVMLRKVPLRKEVLREKRSLGDDASQIEKWCGKVQK